MADKKCLLQNAFLESCSWNQKAHVNVRRRSNVSYHFCPQIYQKIFGKYCDCWKVKLGQTAMFTNTTLTTAYIQALSIEAMSTVCRIYIQVGHVQSIGGGGSYKQKFTPPPSLRASKEGVFITTSTSLIPVFLLNH